jgi:predicted GTPase
MKGQGQDYAKVRRRLRNKFLDYAQILLLHAHRRTHAEAAEAIDRVAGARLRRIPTAELNRFVQAVTAVHPPRPGRREVHPLRRPDQRRASSSSSHERRDVVPLLMNAS